jgi:hypothetical protein
LPQPGYSHISRTPGLINASLTLLDFEGLISGLSSASDPSASGSAFAFFAVGYFESAEHSCGTTRSIRHSLQELTFFFLGFSSSSGGGVNPSSLPSSTLGFFVLGYKHPISALNPCWKADTHLLRFTFPFIGLVLRLLLPRFSLLLDWTRTGISSPSSPGGGVGHLADSGISAGSTRKIFSKC